MFESLRARLLLWHTAIVIVVVTLLNATVCFIAWRARLIDIDAALAERARVLAGALQPAGQGTFNLAVEAGPVSGSTPIYHVLATRDGSLIDRSDAELDAFPAAVPGPRFRNGRRELTVFATPDVRLIVGRDLADVRGEIYRLAATLLAVGVAVLVLSIAGGWLLVGRALAPIARINRTARSMAGGDLSARIPINRVDTDLEQVARALNRAFDGLQASLDRQRQLTADVSHELRTPLATLSSEVQWARSKDREPGQYRESLEICQRAGLRMQGIVERLLSLARAESAAGVDPHTDVRLDDLVTTTAEELKILADRRSITISVNAVPVTVNGDADRLREAFTNVMTNAIVYNIDGGRVNVTVARDGDTAIVTIEDSGMGIAETDLPRVFDPFFRADPARSRDVGGAGLGLAVTRAIVAAHAGAVSCRSSLHQGTTIAIRLPVAAA